MKTVLIIILFLITLRVFCPEAKSLFIEKAKSLAKFDKLIDAITWIESRHGLYVWNPTEGAVGWFQIRECRVKDYNQRRGTNYRLENFYDYELSRKMFIYYAEQIGETDLIIRRWNGSGMKTYEYLKKVKIRM